MQLLNKLLFCAFFILFLYVVYHHFFSNFINALLFILLSFHSISSAFLSYYALR